MPLFKPTSGPEVWIPLERIVALEAGEGGLCTRMLYAHTDPKTGQPMLIATEVEGRVDVLGPELDRLRFGRAQGDTP